MIADVATMTITQKLVDSVEHFTSTPRIIRLAFLLMNLAYPLFIIGFSTNGWLYTSTPGQSSSDKQGLWNHCAASGVFTCCRSLNSYLSSISVGVPAWIDATRTMLCFGFVSSTVAMVTIYLCTLVTAIPLNKIIVVERICYISSYLAGFFTLIGIIVYGTKHGSESWQSGGYLHGSFGVSAAAGILFLFVGVTTSIRNKRNQVAQSAEAQSVDRPNDRATADYNGRLEPSAPPAPQSQEEDNSCCICLDAPVDAAFVSCGHNSCCFSCAEGLFATTKICPICRQTIQRVIKIYR